MITKRIAIFYPFDNFDTVPTLCNAIILLKKSGYFIDIFSECTTDYLSPDLDSDNINFIFFRKEKMIDYTGIKEGNQLFRVFIIIRNKIKNGLRLLRNTVKFWFYQQRIKEILSRWSSDYAFIIGVDPKGLIFANNMTRKQKIPLIYLSLELLLKSEITSQSDMKMKEDEIAFSREALLVIIQDHNRATILSKENGIELKKFVIVPNSPIGLARRMKSNFWHEKFKLPNNIRIVLYAGSLGKWTGIEDIISSVEAWPEHWLLIVHTRFHAEESAELKELQSIAPPERVIFSTKPVPNAQYAHIVEGADIGIAFYQETKGSTYTQNNIREIGYSSGKIAYYLHAGLPVIVNAFSSIGDVAENAGWGVKVHDKDEISDAIVKISQNYKKYSENACFFFNEHLEFEKHFIIFLKKVKEL